MRVSERKFEGPARDFGVFAGEADHADTDVRADYATLFRQVFLNPVVWIMAGYFQSVPRELEEAARIDGASRFQAFLRVALPLALPGLGATAIFTLLNAWDEFFFALIFPSTYASKTLPIALAEFIGRHSVNWGMLVTGGFIASLPPIVLSLVFYRYIVSGLAAGGIKG